MHALRSFFADADTEGVLLVDASNDFNALNRRVTLLKNTGAVSTDGSAVDQHLPNTRSFVPAIRRDKRIYRRHCTGRFNRDGYVRYWSGHLIRRLEAPGAQQMAGSLMTLRLVRCSYTLRRWWDHTEVKLARPMDITERLARPGWCSSMPS